MSDGDDRSLVLLEMLLQPVDRLSVEVVGRLVEQQHIGLLQEQTAESHTAALTTREMLHRLVGWRTAQGIHGTFEFRVHVPCVGGVDDVLQLSLTGHQAVHLVGILVVFGQSELLVDLVVFAQGVVDMLHALHDVLLHRLRVVERRVLRQVAHAVARAPHHLSLILLVQSSDNLHERRLTGTVQTDDAYLRPIEKAEIDVLEHLLLVLLDGLAHTDHRENHFLVVYCCHRSRFLDNCCKVSYLNTENERNMYFFGLFLTF